MKYVVVAKEKGLYDNVSRSINENLPRAEIVRADSVREGVAILERAGSGIIVTDLRELTRNAGIGQYDNAIFFDAGDSENEGSVSPDCPGCGAAVFSPEEMESQRELVAPEFRSPRGGKTGEVSGKSAKSRSGRELEAPPGEVRSVVPAEVISAPLSYIPEVQSGGTKADIGFVKRYIRMHLEEDLSLSRLASLACLSPNYLSTLFKRREGESVKNYIERHRMERASYLLITEESLMSEIALKVGYRHSSYFCRVFKEHYGISPLQFRRRQKGIRA